jgi:hypothetical protein
MEYTQAKADFISERLWDGSKFPTAAECKAGYDSLPDKLKEGIEWDMNDHDVKEEVGSFLFDNPPPQTHNFNSTTMKIPYCQDTTVSLRLNPYSLEDFPDEAQKWIRATIRASTLKQAFQSYPGLKVGSELDAVVTTHHEEGYVVTRRMSLLPQGERYPNTPTYWETTYFHATGEQYTVVGYSAKYDPEANEYPTQNPWAVLDCLSPQWRDYASRLLDLHGKRLASPWDAQDESAHHWINNITSPVTPACKSFLTQVSMKHLSALDAEIPNHFYQVARAPSDLSLFRHLGLGLYHSSPTEVTSEVNNQAFMLQNAKGETTPYSCTPSTLLADPRFLLDHSVHMLDPHTEVLNVGGTPRKGNPAVFVSTSSTPSPLLVNPEHFEAFEPTSPHTVLCALSLGKSVKFPVTDLQGNTGQRHQRFCISDDHILHWFLSKKDATIVALIQDTNTDAFIGGFTGAWTEHRYPTTKVLHGYLGLTNWIGIHNQLTPVFGACLTTLLTTQQSWAPEGAAPLNAIDAAWCGRSYSIPSNLFEQKPRKWKHDPDAGIEGVMLHTDSSIHWPPALDGVDVKLVRDDGWGMFDTNQLHVLKRLPPYTHATYVGQTEHDFA